MNAQLAVKYLQEISFSMILVDFNLQGTRSVDLYQELQLLGNRLPVIVFGEYDEESAILEKMYSGIDDFLLRPFEMGELRMIINRQLERIYLPL